MNTNEFGLRKCRRRKKLVRRKLALEAVEVLMSARPPRPRCLQ